MRCYPDQDRLGSQEYGRYFLPRHLRLLCSCERPAGREPLQSNICHLTLGKKVALKDSSAVGAQAIGPTTTFANQGLDESLVFETTYGSIEGARLKAHPSERLNVLGQCVPVLRTTSQAREDQGGWSGVAP